MNADTKAATRAHYEAQAAQAAAPRMFTSVSCSQCGSDFPGVLRDGGFSACSEHRAPAWSQPHTEADEDRAYDIAMSYADDRDFERERSL